MKTLTSDYRKEIKDAMKQVRQALTQLEEAEKNHVVIMTYTIFISIIKL